MGYRLSNRARNRRYETAFVVLDCLPCRAYGSYLQTTRRDGALALRKKRRGEERHGEKGRGGVRFGDGATWQSKWIHSTKPGRFRPWRSSFATSFTKRGSTPALAAHGCMTVVFHYVDTGLSTGMVHLLVPMLLPGPGLAFLVDPERRFGLAPPSATTLAPCDPSGKASPDYVPSSSALRTRNAIVLESSSETENRRPSGRKRGFGAA